MTTAEPLDPYEGMSAAELDVHFSEVLRVQREQQVPISIRLPQALLDDLKELAEQNGIGYQTLVKRLLSRDVARLRSRALDAAGGSESRRRR